MEEEKNTEETAEKVELRETDGRSVGSPFKKGYDERRNYDGRPQGSISLTTEIKRMLKECPEGEKMTYLELLKRRIIRKAVVEGDGKMISLLWNYIDGMPKQAIEIKPINESLEAVETINSLSDEKRATIIANIEKALGDEGIKEDERDFILGEKS